MTADVLTLAVIVGAFNYLFRYLPLRLHLQATDRGPMARFLASTGPAAIVTLSVSSGLPLMQADARPVVAGVAAVGGIYLWRKSVVLATMAGSLAYGAVFALAGA